jgi:hypothetical protein
VYSLATDWYNFGTSEEYFTLGIRKIWLDDNNNYHITEPYIIEQSKSPQFPHGSIVGLNGVSFSELASAPATVTVNENNGAVTIQFTYQGNPREFTLSLMAHPAETSFRSLVEHINSIPESGFGSLSRKINWSTVISLKDNAIPYTSYFFDKGGMELILQEYFRDN